MIPQRSPLIVNFAPTGMVTTRSLSGHVPLQPQEIIDDVLRGAEKGITIAHLHARDSSGHPTHNKDIYAKIIGGIREKHPELMICVSCSGRLENDLEKRAEVLELKGDLKPDMASLTLSSLNFKKQASINSPDSIEELARRMTDRGIFPELEIFDLGMASYARYLREKGILKSPSYANLFFGNVAGAQANLLEMASLIHALPEGTIWSLAGLGRTQIPIAALAAGFAPGVRIGLEDNMWSDWEHTRPATNLQLLECVAQFLAPLDRPIMPPDVFRTRLNLPV